VRRNSWERWGTQLNGSNTPERFNVADIINDTKTLHCSLGLLNSTFTKCSAVAEMGDRGPRFTDAGLPAFVQQAYGKLYVVITTVQKPRLLHNKLRHAPKI